MSYPHLIQTLIIEDEATDTYDVVFEELVQQRQLAPPLHAYGYEDAAEILGRDRIIHLVILDLRLPAKPSNPPQEGIDHGLHLLDMCANRNHYPIPALLIISAQINQADQMDLERRTKVFAFGLVLVKSTQLEKPLLAAVREVQKYCSKGIHLRDAEEKTYPTLSPWEHDLLRRCMLEQQNCTGVDLRWWSAEYQQPSGPHAAQMGWTKTLTGHFLFGGDGRSRLNFFKFDPADGSDSVLGDVQLMQHKLAHIKVHGALAAGNRSLLVTEKVGSVDRDPISLAEYVAQPSDAVLDKLPGVVADITAQLRALGDSTQHRSAVGRLLWAHHDSKTLAEEWQTNGGDKLLEELGADADPLQLFAELRGSDLEVLSVRQNFLHGDLNITNVAMDRDTDGVAAYIFDASGTAAGVNVRDLANLEVSALLHQPASKRESLVKRCEDFFGTSVSPQDPVDFETGSDLARNTVKLIAEIRLQALQLAEPYVYALMVFDSAIMQLGGLAFGSSCNKIGNSTDAALLAALSARWLKSIPMH